MKNTIIKIFLIVTLCLVFNCQPAQAISETNGVNKESIESIEKLAESGDLLAQEFLSEFYLNSDELNKAMYWAKKTFPKSSPRGALVASIVEEKNGNNILKNQYSDMAAQFAFDSKEPFVASIIFKDMFRRAKKRDAFLLCQLAADYGHEEAQLFMAIFYLEGFGTATSYKDSYIYGLIVRKNGNKAIESLLEGLEKNFIYESDIEKLQNEANILEKKIMNNKINQELVYEAKVEDFRKKISSLQ